MDFTTEDIRIGTVLNGRYEIKKLIATGGMAVVYFGERIELGRPVAIKFLHEVLLGQPKFISRFESEAKLMSKLSHPYCVPVIDFGVEGAPYIVMEYAEGKTLKTLLQEERLSVARALTLTRQILAGIAHAHGQGIVHRDIKPENIMIQEATGMGEHVRIFDFGLAKLLDPAIGSNLSTASLVAGTPNYMSPEQSRGRNVDERTDLYSIGVVLFEMITGRKPFVADDFLEVVRMHRETTPPGLNEVSQEMAVSPELEAVVQRALSKSPDNRYQTAEAFAEALSSTPEGRGEETTPDTLPLAHAKTLAMPSMTDITSHPTPTVSLKGSGFHERKWQTTVAEALRAIRSMSMRLKEAPRIVRSMSRRSKIVAGAVLFVIVGVLLLFGSQDAEDEAEGHTATPPVTAVLKKSPPKVPPSAAAKKAAKDATRADINRGTAAEGQAAEPAEESGQEPGTAALAEIEETPSPVTNLADVQALIDQGDREGAIAGLHKLRRDNPKVAQYLLLLGNLYFEKDWWGDGMEHYQEAIRLNPSYRKRPVIIRNLIVALSGDKTSRKAEYILQKSVGKTALPFLRRAAKKDENPLIRKRAGALVKRMSK